MDVKTYANAEPEVINIRRNPYLADYARQKAVREQRMESRREQPQRAAASRRYMVVTADHRKQSENTLPHRRRTAAERQRAAARRRNIVRMQRLAVGAGVFCIALLSGLLLLKRGDVKAAGSDAASQQTVANGISQIKPPSLVQGISEEDYNKHPDWEENFLTPNEYSRPGDSLEAVNSIFVHYTANPETSAAQNRSYFEQLKDTHDRSASAHFIIGYNGEIIQCIPLDEIAYAVQTRNFDSISIECCYKSSDGSFTQETYDSLINLLAWLTDVYDLSTDDILRHYDCGGKKCPIYYTEHEDAWKKLKSDVAAQQNI